MRMYFSGDTLLEKHLKGVPGKLLAAECCWPPGQQELDTGTPDVLQEPEKLPLLQVATPDSQEHAKHTRTRKQNCFFLHSLQRPLPTKLNTRPQAKENSFKGPNYIFTEQTKRVNSERGGTLSITGAK